MRTSRLTVLALPWIAGSALAEPGAFLAQPDVHGDHVVFTREGDLWLGALSTGKAKRLTRHEGIETRARFSPDGRTIAFTGQYEGTNQLYVMPVDGGLPKRVTNHLATALLEGWTPDGQNLLYTSPDWNFSYKPYLAPLAGGTRDLPIQYLGQGGFDATGAKLAFTRWPTVSGGAWFRYQGGAKNEIWVGDLTALRFTKAFSADGACQFPRWVGDRIYFVREENATFSVGSIRPDGKDYKRHAGPYPVEVFDLETDGKSLVYVKGNELERLDLGSGRTSKVEFDLNSDLIHTKPFKANAAAFVGGLSIGPTGKRVMLEARGQILSVPAKEGAVEHILGRSGVRYELPTLSPDGSKLAYVSDETREQQVYVADKDGKNPVQITKDGGRQLDSIKWSPDGKWLAIGDSESRLRLIKADGSEERLVTTARREITALAHSFSPDSKWLAFVDQKPWVQQSILRVHLHNIEAGTSHPVSDGFFSENAPAFSRDGKFLVMLSRRSVAPEYDALYSQLASNAKDEVFLVALRKSVKSPFLQENDEEPVKKAEEKPAEKPADKPAEETGIDLDGIGKRIIKVPLPAGLYTQVEMVGNRVIAAGDGAIHFYDIAAKRAGRIISGQAFELSADGKKLLVAGGGFRVVDVTATDLPPTTPAINLAPIKVDVDPVKEWEQIFWDAWRLCRDYFYVRNLHGADWDAIGRKYAAMLPHVRARNELTELIRWMQAELSAGHSFRAAPANPPVSTAVAQGYLGIATEAADGYHRVTRVYDGMGLGNASPLAEVGVGVEPGTYLISVAGVPATSDSDYTLALGDKVGQVVAVQVNDKPSKEGARTVYVRAISATNQRTLWAMDEVKLRKEAVDKMSGGKVGYMFLPAMGDPDYGLFTQFWFPQLDKEAILIDIRGNNGGYIGGVLVNILRKETYMRRSQRNSVEAGTRYHDSFEGHLGVIINEESYSDGEGFPNRFKHAGLGPLIGKRTFGALVGSAPMWPLVDGGGIQVPRYGNWRDNEGWVVEGPGVPPDIEVDSDPNDYARGIDTQLTKAVEEMMKRIAAKPIQRPVQPADPTTAKTRGGG